MTDPIADMLNRIRNAQAVSKETVVIPFSNLKYEIAKVLERKGLIGKIEKRGKKEKKSLQLTLKYEQDNSVGAKAGQMKPIISDLRRISKPGRRVYMQAKEIKPVRGGYGMAIISTPKGLMTDKETKKQKLGGEVICEIW